MKTLPLRSMSLMIFLVLVTGLVACGPKTSQPRDTRLTHDDMNEMVNRMAMSLANSEFIKNRTPDSPSAYIMIDRVQNLSSDRIPIPEQWALVSRLRSMMPLSEWAEGKNLYFLITPERRETARRGGYTGEFGPGEKADFLMSADFLSARRAASVDNEEGLVDVMAEQYYMEYFLTDLDRRKILWSDKFEVKREARGLLID